MADDYLQVGKLGAVHGLKGWLKVHAFTEPLDKILQYSPWYLAGAETYQSFKVDAHRIQANGLVVHFAGLDTRELTAHLVNKGVFVKPSQLPKLKKNEYYWRDLIGLRVKNLDGIELGEVMSLLATGANDVLMIEGQKTHCVPYLPKQVIKEIDQQAGWMIVDWPDEL